MTSVSINYDAPPTVRRWQDSDAFVRIIMGPVGSGKSSGCVMENLVRAQQQEPWEGVRRTRGCIVRNTYRELRDTTRKTFEQWLPSILGEWSETDFTFTMNLPLQDGTRIECEILFRALDKPSDVGKVLSLELTWAYINELREVPKEILDGLQMRVGRYPSKAQGGCTWFGVWADTNPWSVGSEYDELFSAGKWPAGFELYEQPDGLGDEAENIENLPQDYYPRLMAGKSSDWVDEYLRGKKPKSDRGSIFGAKIAALEEQGRVCDFEHGTDGVFIFEDIGHSDATSLWFTRFGRGRRFEVFKWYECVGEDAQHVIAYIKATGLGIERIYLPHDARAKTHATKVSVHDQYLAAFPGKVSIVPQLSIADGIDAGRWLLEQDIWFHSRVKDSLCNDGVRRNGLKTLRSYRFKFDEDKKVYSKEPLHDWASHTGSSWRYTAAGYKHSELMSRPEEPAKQKPAPRAGVVLVDDEFLDEAPEVERRIG